MNTCILDQRPPVDSGLPGLKHSTWAGREHGLAGLSLWRQSVAPGAATPPHRHACDEAVVCLAGEGTLVIGGERHRFVGGQTIVVPDDVEHQIVNTGAQPLEIVAALAAAPVMVTLPDGSALPLPWQARGG